MATPIAVSPAQVAFLLWSAVFFGAAVAKAASSSLGLTAGASLALAMFLPLLIDGAVVIGIPRLRQAARDLLRRPIPRAAYAEVALIACIAMLAQPARFAGFALMAWMQGGDPNVTALGDRSALAITESSGTVALIHFALACFAAPLVEEVMYRGFLFPLWARRRSLVTAIVFTALVFGAGHTNYVHAFSIGVLLASLYVRTGSLRAAIFVHFVGNFTSLLSVLGRFAKPADNHGISSWSAQITALVAFAALTFAYLIFATRSPTRLQSTQPASP